MIEQKKHKRLSKFLSLILRHQPETIQLALDKNGWANVQELIEKMTASGRKVDFETLETIVANNDKQRFTFNEKKTQIRANQGHSIPVDLEFTIQEPPEFLYHGTAQKNIGQIFKQGLQKRNRQYVHLSDNIKTAISVGSRHGIPVVLKVRAKNLHESGYHFYLSKNGVWLVDTVPASFLIQL